MTPKVLLSLLILAALCLVNRGQSYSNLSPNRIMSYIDLYHGIAENVCKNNTNGRTLEKSPRYRQLDVGRIWPCTVDCRYVNTTKTETYAMPDNTLCCIVGPGPTGCCRDGQCALLGLMKI